MNRLLKSFAYAWHGIKYCLKYEQNFKIHIAAGAFVIVFAALLKCTAVEWMILCMSIAMVLCAELLNTAIEKYCDMQQKNFSPQIKIIKDTAAGAVLVAAVLAAGCGAVIFVPKLLQLF